MTSVFERRCITITLVMVCVVCSMPAIAGEPTQSKSPEGIAEVLRSGDDDARKRVMQTALGLSTEQQAKLVDSLAYILELDVDEHPISLHANACRILGDVGQKTPSAIDEGVADTLVLGLFLANEKGQNTGRECGLAVQKLGKTAIEPLFEAFWMRHASVGSLLETYNAPPMYAFPSNRARLMAVVRLSSMRASEAVGPFIGALRRDMSAPAAIPQRARLSYLRRNAQTTSEILRGLGQLGDKRARRVLTEALTGELNDQWAPMLDVMVRLQLRQDAGQALNELGDRRALEPMLEMIERGQIENLDNVVPEDRPLDRHQFNWMTARAYANLATHQQVDDFKEVIAATENDQLAAKYRSFLPMFEVARECKNEGDAHARAACYGARLEDDDSLVREKAAYELSRLPRSAAAPVINANLSTEHLDTREVLCFAAYRRPSGAMIQTIDDILEHEADRSGHRYRLDHYRLRLLKAWLANNTLIDGGP